jgi:hypothetical protein
LSSSTTMRWCCIFSRRFLAFEAACAHGSFSWGFLA